MYEAFYQLDKAPFQVTPDPAFLYLSPTHKEALASIVYGVEERKGFVVVLGEVGLGKTTLLRAYLDRLDKKRVTVAYVFNPNIPFKALLDTVLRGLGIRDGLYEVPAMVDQLHQIAIEEYRQGRNLVLIVDEAQNMPVETLESLRVLSNLETSTDKLFQIVLVGQPEFAEKLELRELRQLKQRIAVRCTLSPFSDEESLAYIEHRLNRAGASSPSVFTRGALRRIVRYARGIPRMLNILCDNALVTGLGYRKKPVTAAIVREVIRDLEGKGRVGARRRWAWVSVTALFVIGVVLLVSPGREVLLSHESEAISAPIPVPPPEKLAPEPSQGLLRLVPSADEGGRAEAIPPVRDAGAPQTSDPLPVDTRIVKQGNTLFSMARDVYGFVDARVIQRIVESNPEIADVNKVLVGTEIRFPDVSDLRARRPEPTSQDQ